MFTKTYNKALAIALQPLKLLRGNKQFNPSNPIKQKEDTIVESSFDIYSYDASSCQHVKTKNVKECNDATDAKFISWINMDGLDKEDVIHIAKEFKVHPLLVEDILSKGQRAKADNMDTQLFCLMPMLRYNTGTGGVDIEQLSIALGTNYVLSFQEEPKHDPFNSIRDKLHQGDPILRSKGADYLFYSLIDAVVDQYFNVLDYLVSRLEKLEDEVVVSSGNVALLKISLLRREIMLVKRSIGPVRELISYFLNTDSILISKGSRKYFKDVYDHIMLAIEYTENYRDMIVSLQDLNMNQVNTKMNEVMKTLTVVTTLLAPATVIGGIFGMNFDKIPYQHHPYGFYIASGIMLTISVVMILYFKKKKWF